MNKRTTAVVLIAMAVLILDSSCAARSVRDALDLCARTLIPCLFPLFVVSSLAVSCLQTVHFPWLARLMRLPSGGEGLFALGCVGGFPVGAAAIAQSVRDGVLSKTDGTRMLGLCSCCGPAFLFGVLPQVLPMDQVLVLFILQMETAMLLGTFWPGSSGGVVQSTQSSVSLPEAVRRAVRSMTSVCAWVTLAAVAAGFLRRWLFPLLPHFMAVLLTGLLELTNGILALEPGTDSCFLLIAVFVCFGGVSVLLQIAGLAAAAGLSMKCCITQKLVHGILGAAGAYGYLRTGPGILLLIPGILFAKMTVEIPGRMLYNTPRKEGI